MKKAALVLPAVNVSGTPATTWTARVAVVGVLTLLAFYLGGVVLAVVVAVVAAVVAMQLGGPKKKAAKR